MEFWTAGTLKKEGRKKRERERGKEGRKKEWREGGGKKEGRKEE